jgi:hypothetical protein
MSIIPSIDAENIITEKNTYKEKISVDAYKLTNILNRDPPVPKFTGNSGENNWFIGCVSIVFIYDPGLVQEIWYRIDQGNYKKYLDQPFEYCEDGIHTLHWYWINLEGENIIGNPYIFKIDQTPPTIELTKKMGLNNKVTFTANCEDDASGIEYVEFYLDDELQETIYTTPYKWEWIGTEPHMVYAIGYNFAGFSEKSNTLSTPRSLSSNFLFANKVFQILYHIFLCNL